MNSRIDFLYLDEQDMIEAGVLDMKACINEMEKVFHLLSSGDYIMGGKNNNSHGMLINFPDSPTHKGMPKNGPDRRFMAMPAYLGGEYRVAGCKWRSEEHTSELQARGHLVCRLLSEKKKKRYNSNTPKEQTK